MSINLEIFKKREWIPKTIMSLERSRWKYGKSLSRKLFEVNGIVFWRNIWSISVHKNNVGFYIQENWIRWITGQFILK